MKHRSESVALQLLRGGDEVCVEVSVGKPSPLVPPRACPAPAPTPAAAAAAAAGAAAAGQGQPASPSSSSGQPPSYYIYAGFVFMTLTQAYLQVSQHLLSYPIVSYRILSYPIVSYRTLSYRVLSCPTVCISRRGRGRSLTARRRRRNATHPPGPVVPATATQ
jgi:hypothetical protein